MWQVLGSSGSAVLCLHLNRVSKHAVLCLQTDRKQGRPGETGDQTHKKTGNQGPIQRVCMGAGAHSTCSETGPLPSSSPDPTALDPWEQCPKVGEGDEGVKSKGGRIISLGNGWVFPCYNDWQARFHLPSSAPRTADGYLFWLHASNRTRQCETLTWRAHTSITQVCLSGRSPSHSTKTTALGLQVNRKNKRKKEIWKKNLFQHFKV